MSLGNKASNVLLAKCRAKFGRGLTSQDVTALINCRSVPEVAAYLKQNTRYADALETVDPASLHRKRMENILRMRMADDFSSLCRYELSVGEWFGDYILMRGELGQIMSFLQLLSAGHADEFIFSMPAFYLQHTDFDFAALSGCRSYDDFLRVMRGSRFYNVLRSYTPLDGEPIDCARIEHALYSEFYTRILDIIEKHYSGKAKDELLELIGTQLDILNFCHLYRLKKYYGASPDEVRVMLLGGMRRIAPAAAKRLVEASTAEEALDVFLGNTPYGRGVHLNQLPGGGIESATRCVLYEKALRLLRGSVNPTTVLLSYVILTETELQDVITIVEAVYYGVPPEETLDLITIDDFLKQKI